MVKVSNDFGDRYSGKVGDSGVFASWQGVQYRRRYAKPSNPNSPAQQTVRNSFKNGVAKWKTFNSAQQNAYGPLSAGQPLSGYNLFLRRWQQMTSAERASYVSPLVGFKQVGDGVATAGTTKNIVENQAEYTGLDAPIVIGSLEFTVGTGNLDPEVVVDIKRGRVDVLKNIAGAITIDYVSGGETITAESLGTNATAGDVIYLDNYPVTYKSSTVKVAGSAVQALEVDIVAGKVYVTGDATFTAGGSIDYETYTPVENAKLELLKVNTNFNTGRQYADADGIIEVSQTAEDGNKDITVSAVGYLDIVTANILPASACADEYIALTAL